MKKNGFGIGKDFVFLILFGGFLLIFSGCGIKELKQENLELSDAILRLEKTITKQKNTISQLQVKIQTLEETDQHYFNVAIDAYNKAQASKTTESYQTTIDDFTLLVQKFPKSPYLADAKTYISTSQKEIGKIKAIKKGKDNIDSAIAKHNFNNAYAALNKIKVLISEGEYKTLSERIYEEKNKPLEVAIRDLVAEPRKYHKKRVKLDSLKIFGNNIERGSFDTRLSTGSGFTDYDGDVSIEVFYSDVEDASSVWRNLSSDRRPTISSVIGIFNLYSNSYSEGYIRAQKIIR